MLKYFYLSITFSLFTLLCSSPVLADQGILVELTSIEAHKNQSTQVDPSLTAVKESLLQKFIQYQRFKQLDQVQKNLLPQQKLSLPLSQNIRVNVSYEGEDNGKYKLRLQIPEKKVDLKLKSQNNHTIFQVMQKNQKDTLLILMIHISARID